MGRALMYAIIGVLGVFVLSATLLIESGGKTTATVGEITVAEVLLTPERYEDREISVRGTLIYDEESGQYSVGDEGLQIRITFEPGGIDDLIDQRVRVTGRLEFDSGGAYFDADRVRPV